jgi:hypothetical protein
MPAAARGWHPRTALISGKTFIGRVSFCLLSARGYRGRFDGAPGALSHARLCPYLSFCKFKWERLITGCSRRIRSGNCSRDSRARLESVVTARNPAHIADSAAAHKRCLPLPLDVRSEANRHGSEAGQGPPNQGPFARIFRGARCSMVDPLQNNFDHFGGERNHEDR